MSKASSDRVAVLDRPAGTNEYETDFFTWTVRQARAVREGRWEEVDWENVAEEIESVGRNDRRAVTSHLEILMAHLLKCIVQPDRRTVSWDQTIRAQRNAMVKLIERSPSLRGLPAERFAEVYGDAVSLAHRDTGIDMGRFPKEPPFTLDEVLSPDFFPGPFRGERR